MESSHGSQSDAAQLQLQLVEFADELQQAQHELANRDVELNNKERTMQQLASRCPVYLRMLLTNAEILLTDLQSHSILLTQSHTHTPPHTPYTCTCCYDLTKGTQGKDFSYSFSDSLSRSPANILTRLSAL